MIFDTHIRGMKCLAEVRYHPADPAGRDYPGEPEGYELVAIYDRTGYPAEWLRRRARQQDVERIEREALEGGVF